MRVSAQLTCPFECALVIFCSLLFYFLIYSSVRVNAYELFFFLSYNAYLRNPIAEIH